MLVHTNDSAHAVQVCIELSFHPPGVYDVLLAASQFVAVEDEVTVSTIKVTVGRGIHRQLVTVLDTPNLKTRPQSVLSKLSHTVFCCRHLKGCQLALTWTLPLPSSTMPCWAAMALLECRVEASKGTCSTLAMRLMV